MSRVCVREFKTNKAQAHKRVGAEAIAKPSLCQVKGNSKESSNSI